MENSTSVELKRKHHFKNTRKKTPTVFQMEATECGAASLTMILGYFGCNQPLEKMRIECGVSRDGTNAKNIVRAARKYGLETKGYSKEVDELLEMPTPCIIHWNFNHFVVFEGTKGKHVYINDPALGRRKLTYEDLDDSFTGIVITFNKTDELITQKKNSSLLKFISNRLSDQKKNLLALLLAGFILVVPGIVLPVFSKMFVDDILLGGNTSWLGVMLVAMAGTIAFQGLFTWMKAMLINHLQMKMSLISGYAFLEKMFKLPVDFFNQRYAGDLAQRVTNNDTANNFLTGDLIEMIISVITASFFLILLILYSPILTFVGVLGVLFSVSMSLYFSKELENLSIKGQQDNGKLTGAFYSGISLTSTLKACGAENEYASRLLGIYANTTKTSQKIGRMQQILLALPTSMNDVTNILVVMTGGVMVIKGQLTAGVLVAFSQLLSSFSNPVNNLVSFFQKIQTMKADLSRVEDIENYQADKENKKVESDNSVRSKLSGNVDIKNISFGYSSLNPPFINDFSISIKPGQIVALVGGSGSGKSTIAKMISGLYEPWSGEILFDGQRRDEIDEGVINSSVSNVSQSISLFTGTIKDNLTLWNSYVMEQDIVMACKDACIHDTITKLPGAYSHILAEGGSNLSGGQRQRLEIARALSANPTVLVMDEATSALDPIVEKEIMDNVRRRGCTCIIVAHRLSTIRDADEIVVLDKGVIVERGNHEELVKLGGKYARLISMM